MRALRASEHFASHIAKGKQAIKGEHRALILEDKKSKVSATIDFEAAVEGIHADRKRWDYFLELESNPAAMHGVEIHKFDRSSLHSKKVDTLAILADLCAPAVMEIRSWTVIVKGNLPRQDLVARFSADTKIKVRRSLSLNELK